MTKITVAKALQSKTNLDREKSKEALEIFLSAVKDGLIRGEKVALVGFGTFLVKNTQPRNGRNPKSGESVEIPGKKVVRFKPGLAFRKAVGERDGDKKNEA